MYSVLSPTLSAARNALRTMSSLAPGYIFQGARWNYRILEAIKGDNTHISTIFKAEVIPHENTRSELEVPRWACIKAASPSDAAAVKNMDRERQSYRLPGVASAECFREMLDVIDDSTIALEWLDTTLAEVEYVVLKTWHPLITTDYKPANILLSGIGTDRATANVGDLGLVVPVGTLFNAQPYAMRAPEVFLGQACTEPSQVWAVAAMLLCWIKPGILGMWDSLHPLVNESWSMAKIKRLFPHWNIPTPNEVDGHSLKAAVNSATCFSEEVPELQAILPFDREMEKVEMPQQLKDLLRFMFVVNPATRPSASTVLASREFGAFEEFVDV